ncbi:ATP-binding protein [Pseudoscardovia suis]|nr:ATP-binding protein [Pseudoscardovia suis]
MPPILIGRQSIIDDFQEALDNGIGAPGRIMLVTGQRGFGKTVMLTQFRRIAREQGWLTIAETASEGLVDRLAQSLDPQTGSHVSSAQLSPTVSAAGVGASLGQVTISKESAPLTLRTAMQHCLSSKRTKKGKGVVITIDEMQSATTADIVAIATAVQHTIAASDELDCPEEDKRGIAIVFAGLPSMLNELINNRTTTFMRRALQRELQNVPIPDVRDAYLQSVVQSGKAISAELATQAARESDGYPYMVQLLGYYMWQSAQRRRSQTIEEADLRQGYADAITAFDQAVCAPALDELGTPERVFLQAMAQSMARSATPTESANPSSSGKASSEAAHSATAADAWQPITQQIAKTSDIASFTSRSRSWVSKYRAVLLRDHVIESAGHGYVRFAIPHMRDYLLGTTAE